MLVFVSPEPAGAQSVSCPDDPGPIGTSITNDAAIEVHALRREQVEACIAVAVAVEGADSTLIDLRTSAEEGGDIYTRLDLAWWGAWAIVGLLLALLVAPMMQRAFRWWRE
jgi:hypothetical protein